MKLWPLPDASSGGSCPQRRHSVRLSVILCLKLSVCATPLPDSPCQQPVSSSSWLPVVELCECQVRCNLGEAWHTTVCATSETPLSQLLSTVEARKGDGDCGRGETVFFRQPQDSGVQGHNRSIGNLCDGPHDSVLGTPGSVPRRRSSGARLPAQERPQAARVPNLSLEDAG